jgi:broad specificity phosphatase PhoE
MENTIKIILVRHGQSIGNQSRTFLGHTDLDLSDLGYKQAYTTAEHLRKEKIHYIYSSDLIRAYNTAIPHAKIRNMTVIRDKNLREAYVGSWEGMNVDDIIEKWGSEVFVDQWKNNFGLFTFPNGESIKGAGERFYNEILSICSNLDSNIVNETTNITSNNDKTVDVGEITILIASHAAVIRSFWSIISGVPFDELAEKIPFPTNASYSIAYYKNGKITPFSYSNDDHLRDVGITKVNLI